MSGGAAPVGGHTPGPWYAEIRNGSASILRRPPSDLYENGGGVAGEKSIATVSRGWYHEGSAGFPFEANARLIAAAPDLLASLIEMRDLFDTLCSIGFNPCEGREGSPKANADAAIAKATGKQA